MAHQIFYRSVTFNNKLKKVINCVNLIKAKEKIFLRMMNEVQENVKILNEVRFREIVLRSDH